MLMGVSHFWNIPLLFSWGFYFIYYIPGTLFFMWFYLYSYILWHCFTFWFYFNYYICWLYVFNPTTIYYNLFFLILKYMRPSSMVNLHFKIDWLPSLTPFLSTPTHLGVPERSLGLTLSISGKPSMARMACTGPLPWCPCASRLWTFWTGMILWSSSPTLL